MYKQNLDGSKIEQYDLSQGLVLVFSKSQHQVSLFREFSVRCSDGMVL